jgi:predicted FMN-binding regulatory protein PaiB
MYIPKPFSMPEGEVLDFIRSNPFGILVTAAADGIKATHIPFHVKETKDSSILTVVFHLQVLAIATNYQRKQKLQIQPFLNK